MPQSHLSARLVDSIVVMAPSATLITLRASEAAAQCIVIVTVCLCACVCVCVWGGLPGEDVCYHDNSKLRASILTKLGL